MPECNCEDWSPCPCGNDGPWHCQYCCLDLTPEQLMAFDFKEWEYIPRRPRKLPARIHCGKCELTIDNPTQADLDFHFGDPHGDY